MRLSRTIDQFLNGAKTTSKTVAIARFAPSVRHKYVGNDDDNRQELQADAPSHQLLTEVGIIAFHHRVQPHEQHDEDDKNGNRGQKIKKGLHRLFPWPKSCFCLSLRFLDGNRQVMMQTSQSGAKSGRRPSITHLKFALGGKSFNCPGAPNAKAALARLNSPVPVLRAF
jgi:hypothetical protein